MTLTVCVRIPDGIVLATDSLMTIQTQLTAKGEVGLKCPQCKGDIKISDLPVPPITIPTGSSAYGQKLFNIKKRNVGIATYGLSFLTGRTFASHMWEFERKNIAGEETVEEVARKLGEYFQKELTTEVGDINKLPGGVVPIGFQVAGYDKEDVKIGKTFLVKTGRSLIVEAQHIRGYGCMFGGNGAVVLKLWKEDPEIPIPKPHYQFLSQQDGIDYAIFLIRTTIEYQRFATMMPTCGGEIDVAIITPSKGFEWIQCKKLSG